jgi:Domain of unknown function (DUF5666)
MLKLVMGLFRDIFNPIASATSWPLAASVAVILMVPSHALTQDVGNKPAASSTTTTVAKAVGTIKTIQADSIIVSAESGGEVTAKLTGSTKIQRVPPGETTLKNATTLQAQDLQPGDRVLVRGQASADGSAQTITALSVIVMKQSDVSAKQQKDRDDWQKRGVDGLVTKVDAATGAITISSGAATARKSVAIYITKDTILRRYAPDSVKFDDAKPAPVDRIKAGDQLRARGTRSADGSEFDAEEIVSGAFRNIAGTIKSINAAASTMTVQDAISKSEVTVKVSGGSQIKKLPQEMAQRIAMRLKGGAAAGNGAVADHPGGSGKGVDNKEGDDKGVSDKVASGQASPTGGAGQGGNGPPDFQRMLGRLPNSTLADLNRGDAVIILSTEGSDSTAVTAITLVSGVEAILTAAPNRTASSLLSPWTLSGGGEGEGAQ